MPARLTYSISGTVSTSSGGGLAGVTMTRTGGTSTATTTTDSSGAYTFAGLAAATYTVTPSMTGYSFDPENLQVPISGADMTGQNFTATAACPPAAIPTGVTATPGTKKITIKWSASSGAQTYNVKRSEVSGGPYTTIASGVSKTSYVNTGLGRGVTYYYVVSAVNGCAEESGNSAQVQAAAR